MFNQATFFIENKCIYDINKTMKNSNYLLVYELLIFPLKKMSDQKEKIWLKVCFPSYPRHSILMI